MTPVAVSPAMGSMFEERTDQFSYPLSVDGGSSIIGLRQSHTRLNIDDLEKKMTFAPWWSILIVLWGLLMGHGAMAQGFPNKPIRIVVPYPPGGSTDIIGRLTAQKMAEVLNATVVVENRPGAGTNIGTEHVAQSAPDGHTLLIASFANAVSKALFSKLPFDPDRDFVGVAQVSTSSLYMAVNPEFPGTTVADFLREAKAAPGKFNYGIGGAGSSSHIATELLMSLGGVNLTPVLYKGGAAALVDLQANRIHLIFDNPQTIIPLYRAGKLKVLGLSGKARSPVLPNVPTLDEAAVPGYELFAWFGVLAPAKTPPDVLAVLERAVMTGVRQADIRDRFAGLGVEPVSSGSAEFTRFYRSEIEKWGSLARQRNIKAE